MQYHITKGNNNRSKEKMMIFHNELTAFEHLKHVYKSRDATTLIPRQLQIVRYRNASFKRLHVISLR